ncbi:MAG: GTPase Obg [Candidatus Woesearchaeota archaeon]|nr:GTPase Obg [Candidatus Woesearchaeota archaeon]
MGSTEDKIKEIEDELKKTKYNKATQHHIGLLKAKLARLRDESSSGSGAKGTGYSVKKTGDATVVLVGFPSVGKSTLINSLTNAESKVGAYDFTTLDVIPGALEYQGADIQILDVPGIIEGASKGKGRGREIFSVLRIADLIVIVLDGTKPEHLDIIKKEMYNIGIRANSRKPYVKIDKKSRGGIDLSSTVKLDIKKETIIGILREFKITNGDVLIRDKINEDQLIDVLEDNKVYVPALIVINKKDLLDKKEIKRLKKDIKPDLFISAQEDKNLDELKELIFSKLGIIRIYCKQPGKEPDMDEALIIEQGGTIKDICKKLHKDFVAKFKYARIWGSAKYPGLKIRSLDYEVKDKDIVELNLR